ncbi:hypothetical protein LTR36_007890 [Oleoguttula mirabilis]|uniref:R3H domain-containing protein n=1 Tax=Oleoguttula mirabilis TaxID=1507867 RepID=A0AAV9J956_9PEZI|nr:hypothetical protein LTR36_007890 [Oleoguttula mirabilis]
MENQCHAPYPCKEDKPCQSKIYITCSCQAQKQEAKCGASKTGDGNTEKSLPCNDECARLERNRKLALALNIDQSSHVGNADHIPYSTDTLNLFSEHVKWCQTHEREFRVFASSDDEKRLRFKPMKAHERAFVHALAGDFGLDSESMDPEPMRFCTIYKTPRFVSPPNKTLAEALRIRSAHRSTSASADVSDNEGAAKKTKASNEVGAPYDAFVISNPRFGLTVDELRAELTSVLHPGLAVTFNIDFLPNEEILLKGVSRTLSPHDLQQALVNIKTPLVAAVTAKSYGNAQLCSTDSSLNILRRESDSLSTDGWSRVAAKKAAPKMALQSGGISGSNNIFAALTGSKVTFARKKPEKVKPKQVPIVDDWEAAELAEEEKENATSGDEDSGLYAGVALSAPTPTDELGAVSPPDDAVAETATGGALASDNTNRTQEVDAEGVTAQDWASQAEQAAQ